MLISGVLAAVLYGAVTLVFLIRSAAELLQSGVSSNARLAGVLVAAVFWPVTTVVLSLSVYFANAGQDKAVSKRSVPLKFSHTPR
ncbi:hypothetical protein FMN50_00235 [Rhodobacterales bacterium]|nr:hypothetical protein FMN50_00235 [Rhodobacterales bacterium]